MNEKKPNEYSSGGYGFNLSPDVSGEARVFPLDYKKGGFCNVR